MRILKLTRREKRLVAAAAKTAIDDFRRSTSLRFCWHGQEIYTAPLTASHVSLRSVTGSPHFCLDLEIN